MKKFLVGSILAMAALIFFSPSFEVKAAECGTSGKVVLHYYKYDQDYSSAGIWTWDNGSNGSVDAVPVLNGAADEEGFGIIEICIDLDAADMTNIIPISQNIDQDSRWDFRERADGSHLQYDVTDIKDGTVAEKHIYFISGGNEGDQFFEAPEGLGLKVVVYFDPKAVVNPALYDPWSVWSWQNGTGGSDSGIDLVTFERSLNVGVSVKDKVMYAPMRVAFIKTAEDGSPDGSGFIVRTDEWDKQCPDDLFLPSDKTMGSGVQVFHYIGGQCEVITDGATFMSQVATAVEDNSIPVFLPFDFMNGSGTFAHDFKNLYVALSLKTPMATIESGLVVRDSEGNELAYTLESKGDPIKTFKVILDEEVSADTQIVLDLVIEDEVASTIDVDMPNQGPSIRFNKKADFVIGANEKLDINNYINVSQIVDDRDHLTVEDLTIETRGSKLLPGTMEVVLSATDSHGNTTEEVFEFKVTGVSYALVGGLVVILGVLIFVLRRKKK
jgi:hypothetical protein